MVQGRQGRIAALVVAIAFVATACAWGQAGGNAARNGANPFEPSLTPDNVGQLRLSWQAARGPSEPVMNAKYVYSVTAEGRLVAYAAGGPGSPEGASHCGGDPVQCTPVWSASLADTEIGPPFEVAVDGDVVFAAGYLGGRLQLLAFAADPASCPPAPEGCPPIWTGYWGGNTLFGFSLTVADGRVYISSYPNDIQGFPYVVAFDAHGVTNCTAGPPRSCSPMFRYETTEANGQKPQIAVASGRLFVTQIGRGTFVYDAAGQTGCANAICTSLYALETPNAVSISGSTVYSADGTTLKAFDATGVTRCSGTPRVCSPLWTGVLTAPSWNFDPPTVSNGKVVVFEQGGINDQVIEAFDASGVQACTGAPATCQPLWGVVGSETPGYPMRITATPTLLLLSGSVLKVFDLAGSRSCGGVPKRCTALATIPSGEPTTSRAGVAFGRVAVTDSDFLRVFALPS